MTYLLSPLRKGTLDLPTRILMSAMTRTRSNPHNVPTELSTPVSTKAKGNAFIADGKAGAVAFGVPDIANPDLVERPRRDAPLSKPDPSTFYGEGAKGSTDYPALAEAERP